MTADEFRWPEDSLLDALVLTEAFRRDDENTVADCAAIVPSMSSYEVVVHLARLLAAAADTAKVPEPVFREWFIRKGSER
jgi:hypothetical protein